jgi:hypothetical protein
MTGERPEPPEPLGGVERGSLQYNAYDDLHIGLMCLEASSGDRQTSRNLGCLYALPNGEQPGQQNRGLLLTMVLTHNDQQRDTFASITFRDASNADGPTFLGFEVNSPENTAHIDLLVDEAAEAVGGWHDGWLRDAWREAQGCHRDWSTLSVDRLLDGAPVPPVHTTSVVTRELYRNGTFIEGAWRYGDDQYWQMYPGPQQHIRLTTQSGIHYAYTVVRTPMDLDAEGRLPRSQEWLEVTSSSQARRGEPPLRVPIIAPQAGEPYTNMHVERFVRELREARDAGAMPHAE